VNGYTLTYQEYTFQQIEESGNKSLNQVVMDVYRGDRKVSTVRPERNQHSNVDGAVTEVALRSNLKEDLYIVLAGLDPDGLAAFQVLINPLVVWLWIGGVVLIVGTLITAWPARKRRG
jgi:cytochrome c-type biogenesis protein CcmF